MPDTFKFVQLTMLRCRSRVGKQLIGCWNSMVEQVSGKLKFIPTVAMMAELLKP